MILTFAFWLIIVLTVATPIALMEIYNDTDPEGWFWAKRGKWSKTKFVNPFWEERAKVPLPFIKYFTRYHAFVFVVIEPLTVLYLLVPLASALMQYDVLPDEATFSQALVSKSALFVAIWLGVGGIEDFFYFTFQSLFGWYEPHALRRVVLDKDFDWFKDWLPPVFGLNIPGHWIFCPAASIALLLVRQYLITR